MPGGSPATDFSVGLLAEFVACGVRDLVLSPGSRSQALALAAAEFERAGLLRLHVRIDERVGGFLALGLAVESRMPVLVVTTSGTAVANLHPAVLEAHHSGVPVILLTADRPAELRGIGSNQTTDQPGIFGNAVHWMRDIDASGAGDPGAVAREAFAAAIGWRCGPVHLNVAFREPLSGAVAALGEVGALGEASARGEAGDVGRASVRADAASALPTAPPLQLDHLPGTVVIAGHGAGPRAEELSRELGVPLVAEVSSGARFGPNLVVAYRELLADAAFGGCVRRAIVFGHPTLSREVPALLQRADVEMIVVRGPAAEDYNPGRRASHIVDAVSDRGNEGDRVSPGDRAWLGEWVHASRLALDDGEPSLDADRRPLSRPELRHPEPPQRSAAALAAEQLALYRAPVTRRMLVNTVWNVTWPHDRLVFGASRLIREADRVVPGKRITVHANRGLAGIDGTVATATGIALASGSAGVTRVLLGDLTLLHDVGALLFATGERRARLQVIVGNDGGGTIFDGLEVSASAPRDAFDRVLYTPQSVDLRALSAAYGWRYLAVTNRGELDAALAASDTPTLIDVPLSRA